MKIIYGDFGMKIAVYNDKENCMKIKNIVITCAMILGLSFAVSDGYAFAKEDTLRTFEEFVQDENNFAKWEKDHAAHIKKIQELKDERRVRRLEYKAFTHNPNAEPKQISKAARDIVMLDRQIQTLNEEFIKNTRENYGVDFMGFEFHRNFAPCFNSQYPPMNCPAFNGEVPIRKIPPHHVRRAMPHHELFGEMPPFAEDGQVPMEKPGKMQEKM